MSDSAAPAPGVHDRRRRRRRHTRGRGGIRPSIVAACAALLLAGAARADPVTVKVGGYTFPPFVRASAGEPGAVRAVLSALNDAQAQYAFAFVSTSARRRYRDFQQGAFDVMLFEQPQWSWGKLAITVETVPPIVRGAEVYVARKDQVTGPTYFADLHDKRIAAYHGYHYTFTGFAPDPETLKRNFDFDVHLNHKHGDSIRQVLDGRADVAVVTRSWLDIYKSSHPNRAEKLTVADRVDQVYRLGAITRPGGPISAEALTALLRDLERTGRLREVLAPFGLADQIVLDADES